MKHIRTFLLLTLLSFIGVSCTDGERMRQQLAYIQACNQADTVFSARWLPTVDSLTDYFDRHGTPNEQMLAHYLLARTYTDMGEAPQALDEFHRAAECADTTAADCDYHLLTKVHGQSANLFLEQLMPYEMLEELQLQSCYAQKANDTLISILALEWQHMAYDMLGQSEKAEKVLREAYENYCNLGYYEAAANCASPLCAYCVEQNDYDEARKYISFRNEFYKEGINEDDIFHYYLGLYYIGIEHLDSAEIHLKRLVNSTVDPNKLEAACKGLAMLYQKEGKEDSVAKYFMLSYQTSEKRFRSSNTEELRRIQSLYNYNRSQRIAHEQSQKAQRHKMGTMLFAFLTILLFLCIVAYRHYKKEQMKQIVSEYHHLIELQEQAKYDLVQLKQQEFDNLLQQKQSEIEEWQNEIKKTQSLLSPQIALEPQMTQTEIYQRLQYLIFHPTEKMKKGDWKDLTQTVNVFLPNFKPKVYSLFHLSEDDFHICLLIRLNFSLSEIGILTNKTPQEIYKRRKYMMKKMFNLDERPERFDKMIKNIL